MNILPPPGPERRRQLTLLSIMLLVLVVYFGYRYWPQTAGTSTSSNEAGQGNSGKTEKLPVPAKVRLDDLEAAPPGSEVGRNPFRFGEPPRPTLVAPPPPLEPPAPPPPPPPPPAPQVPLRLLSLGKVTATNQRLVNLLDPVTGANWWVSEGAIIDGKYKLVKVNVDSVVVAFRDGSGQKPLYLR
jgi:hypothetical protein